MGLSGLLNAFDCAWRVLEQLISARSVFLRLLGEVEGS